MKTLQSLILWFSCVALVLCGCGQSGTRDRLNSNQHMKALSEAIITLHDQKGEWPKRLSDVEAEAESAASAYGLKKTFAELMKNPATGDDPGYEYVVPTGPLSDEEVLLYQLRGGERDTSLPVCFQSGSVRELTESQRLVADRAKADSKKGAALEPNKTDADVIPPAFRYVPEDAFFAVAIHPGRMLASEVGTELRKLRLFNVVRRQMQVPPENFERMTFAMAIPTVNSEDDCVIGQVIKPFNRQEFLTANFDGEPFREVKFQGQTYYTRGEAIEPDAVGKKMPAIAGDEPVPPGNVLAKFPEDLQPNANGHKDVSDSGNWLYFSSHSPNPSDPNARLYQLKWSSQRKKYVGQRGDKGNENPLIDRYIEPSPIPPHHAVLRWKSRISGNITIRGSIRKASWTGTRSDADGVRVLVFVDGKQEFTGNVANKPGSGVEFNIQVTVKPESIIDFLADPKGNHRGDGLEPQITISLTGDGGRGGVDVPLAKTPEAVPFDPDLPQLQAVYFPDEKTVVITDEARVRKIIQSDGTKKTPLIKMLERLDFAHDIVGAVTTDGLPEDIVPLSEIVAHGTKNPDQLNDLRKSLKSAVFMADLSGDELLRVECEATGEPTLKNLEGHAKRIFNFVNLDQPAGPQGQPGTLFDFTSQLATGTSVRIDGMNVIVTIKRPISLTNFIASTGDQGIRQLLSLMGLGPAGLPARDPEVAHRMDPEEKPPVKNAPAKVPMDDPADAKPNAPKKIIEPLAENWAIGKGNVRNAGQELLLDDNGASYWVISRDPLPTNFRVKIEGRISFLQGGQVLQSSQANILRSMCFRFCTPDQKADILESKGYHIRHSHSLLLLSKNGEIIENPAVDNGPVRVGTLPIGRTLKITNFEREPSPFTTIITKQDGRITIEFNGQQVVDHSDRFVLSTRDKLAIGGYLSRMHLGRVTIEDLGGEPEPRPAANGNPMELADPNVDRANFQSLPLADKVETMVLTEDGRHLIASHNGSGTVSIVEVDTLKLIKTISTPAPVAMLARGDELIVANHGRGSLSVFSRSKGWENVKTVQAGDPNPEYMSAPGGKYFNGMIAVRCKGNGRDECPINIVNIRRGVGVQFSNGRTSACPVDYTGKIMLNQSRPGSPNRYIEGIYNFATAASGRPTPKPGQHLDSLPVLYQVGMTQYWMGGRKIYDNMPPMARLEAESLLIADRVADVCYVFNPTHISCVLLDRDLKEIQSRELTLPGGIRDVTDVGDLHIAATIGEYLYLFLLTDRQEIVTARLPAFEVPKEFAETDRSREVKKAWDDLKHEDAK